MTKIKIQLNNGKEVYVQKGIEFYSLLKDDYYLDELPLVLAKLNDEYYELTAPIEEDGVLEDVRIDCIMGMKTYIRTLQFVLIKAVLDIFPDSKITIEHAISKGIFGEIHKETALDEEEVKLIKNRMDEIIRKDLKIKKVSMSRLKAIEIFASYGMDDKVKLLKYVKSDEIKLYELDGRYDYFYGSMGYSTGILKYFELKYNEPGFIIRYPDASNPKVIPKFIEQPKLNEIFYETENWLNILEVPNLGFLNEKIENGDIGDVIRVSEALHEKKIANIADMVNEKNEVKIVLIAGPSSSGKTTFAKRLGIQLRVNGLIPIPISLDDYFIDRNKTPLDENGKPDFESINALDLDLFNEHLSKLLKGKYVEIPIYNFITGKREWKNNIIRLPQNGVLIIEGIHGLNDKLTSSIPAYNKFKIYISALTQLNVDNHNRIATTDVRKIRRIVRDSLSRGYDAEDTLRMWPDIKKGEEKNIFVYQEQADVMFNSTLVYELAILKKYAIKELSKIKKTSDVYYEALRLKSFLNLFEEVNKDMVPENSILREFIGGSCFYKY
ncbi:nucleoside kinase [Clostridium fallax]|uniref:Uridine kinase n=1 Tax=Clostridium fallax TaxID=1533 RepID=A0A1M4STR8_9CLOT|nr:nucleoside kinase [Clostridium fallax]SHE35633.1 uridine kinase [Clostridium fallax]SQB07969.1 phosphoribulokinase family protein [Clostridium fallax]